MLGLQFFWWMAPPVGAPLSAEEAPKPSVASSSPQKSSQKNGTPSFFQPPSFLELPDSSPLYKNLTSTAPSSQIFKHFLSSSGASPLSHSPQRVRPENFGTQLDIPTPSEIAVQIDRAFSSSLPLDSKLSQKLVEEFAYLTTSPQDSDLALYQISKALLRLALESKNADWVNSRLISLANVSLTLLVEHLKTQSPQRGILTSQIKSIAELVQKISRAYEQAPAQQLASRPSRGLQEELKISLEKLESSSIEAAFSLPEISEPKISPEQQRLLAYDIALRIEENFGEGIPLSSHAVLEEKIGKIMKVPFASTAPAPWIGSDLRRQELFIRAQCLLELSQVPQDTPEISQWTQKRLSDLAALLFEMLSQDVQEDPHPQIKATSVYYRALARLAEGDFHNSRILLEQFLELPPLNQKWRQFFLAPLSALKQNFSDSVPNENEAIKESARLLLSDLHGLEKNPLRNHNLRLLALYRLYLDLEISINGSQAHSLEQQMLDRIEKYLLLGHPEIVTLKDAFRFMAQWGNKQEQEFARYLLGIKILKTEDPKAHDLMGESRAPRISETTVSDDSARTLNCEVRGHIIDLGDRLEWDPDISIDLLHKAYELYTHLDAGSFLYATAALMREGSSGRVKRAADHWYSAMETVRESGSGATLWPYGFVYHAPRIISESAYYVIPVSNTVSPLSRATGRFLKKQGIKKTWALSAEISMESFWGGSIYWGLHTGEDLANGNTLRLSSDYMTKNYLCSLALFTSIPVGFRSGTFLGKKMISHFPLFKNESFLLVSKPMGVVVLYSSSRALMAQMVKTQAEQK